MELRAFIEEKEQLQGSPFLFAYNARGKKKETRETNGCQKKGMGEYEFQNVSFSS